RFVSIARAAAGLADNRCIGEEAHLEGNLSLSLALGAAAFAGIVREEALLPSACLRFDGLREQLSHLTPNSQIGRRRRTRIQSDRLLIDGDDAVDRRSAFENTLGKRPIRQFAAPQRDAVGNDAVHERALSRARYSCHRG